MKIFSTILIFLSFQSALFSQFMHFYEIDSKNYPIITAKFFVMDQDNNQVNDFTLDDFIIKENNIKRNIVSIDCPGVDIKNKISTVLTLDVSRSMSGDRLDWVKNSAKQWVNNADSLNEETAITTFSDEALLYIDFINDSYILSKVIDTISVRNGTNYKSAFLTPYAGALEVARRGKYLPVIIFLTDGVGLTNFSEKDVIDKARAIGATIYVISIDISAPKELRDIAEATGGQYFEKIDSQEKLSEAYRIIRQFATKSSPCEISWLTEGCIQAREVEFNYLPYNLKKSVPYDTPGDVIPQFVYLNDEFAVFECEVPKKYVVRLQAKNGDIQIDGLNENSDLVSCEDFTAKFVNFSPPAVLPKDSILEIEITYTPTSNQFKYCEFEINGSSCVNNSFYAISKCQGTAPSNVYVKVVSPNGGEVFRSGSSARVIWGGTSKEDDIFVDYSLDSGKSWSLVNAGKLYNQSLWQLPNAVSDKCLVRVKKMSNLAGQKVYDMNVDSNGIKRISWNYRGDLFAVATDTNTILIINSITRKIVKSYNIATQDIQFLPDGFRLCYTQGDRLFYLNLINNDIESVAYCQGEIDMSSDNTVLTITNSDKIYIFDLNSKSIISTINKPLANVQIRSSAISNDSQNLAFCTSSDDDKAAIYIYTKSPDWKHFKTFTLKDSSYDYSYLNLDWSFDDKYLYNYSKYKTVSYLGAWDVENKKLLSKIFNPHFASLSVLDASKKDNLFVTADVGSKVFVWSLENNSLKQEYEFVSNSFINNCVAWSEDATRFVVGTSGLKTDNLLAVYSVKPFPEMQDISDSVFSIVKTAITANPIDLGGEIIGRTKDSLVSNLLTYDYPFNIEIDSVYISGFDKYYFSVTTSPNLPEFINNKSQPDFVFSFTPVRMGTHQAKLNIESEFGLTTVPIVGIGIKPDIKTEDYNFGEVLITKDSVITQKSITNNGNSNLHINKISVVGPSYQFFSILDSANKVLPEITNIQLAPNEEFELKVKFSPLVEKILNARIRVEYQSDSVKVEYINLYGEGINPILDANNVNFDNVVCNELDTQSVTIYNTGSGTLLISDIKLNSLNFKILDIFNFDEKITNRDSLTFDVEFRPIDQGIIRDSIIIFTNQLNNRISKIYLNARKLPNSYEILGNKDLIGIEPNTVSNNSFEIANTGRASLIWNLPYQSADGKIVVNSVTPNPTLPGDTSIISYTFNGGSKSEIYTFNFAPQPGCTDSIDIKVQVKDTSPILYTDFPNIFNLICNDTLKIKIPITNAGEEELKITDIRFDNTNSSNFSINKKIVNLQENMSDTLFVTFYSQSSGVFEADIVFKSNDSKSVNGKLIKHIKVVKDISDFNIIEDSLDFIFVGLNNPGSKTFRIKNDGTVPIKWNFSNIPDFNIISIIPQIALPGVTSEVTLLYSGPSTTKTISLFVSDSCGNLDSIFLNVVSANDGFAILKLDNERRRIGEIFNYDIQLTNTSKLKTAGVTSIKGELVFNHSLMIPININNTITNGIRYVPFEITDLTQGSIYSIQMEALWGDDSCTTVSVSNLQATGNTTNIDFNQIPGSLCISDLCYEGGVRLLDLSQEISFGLKSKVTDGGGLLELKLSLIENGLTTINLYDINGRKIKEIVSKKMQAGTQTFMADLSNITNGPYFIEVVTPTLRTYNKLLIIH